MRKSLMIFACLLSLSLMGLAQTTNDFYFGYSHLTPNRDGWNATIDHDITRHVQIVGDLAGDYGNSGDVHSFLAGVKVDAPHAYENVTPWGRFLIGPAHISPAHFRGDTSLAWTLGGGVDVKLVKRVGTRFGLDAFHDAFYDSGETHCRASMGLFYRF